MKVHFRIDKSNLIHTHLTVFIDGQNCGSLCLGTEKVLPLETAILLGFRHYSVTDEYELSGELWYK